MSARLPVGLQSRDGDQTPPRPPSRRDRRAAGGQAGRPARARSAFRPAADVLSTVAANAQRSRLPQMAAALAYRTLFGLIPVMVVALVGLKMFTTPEDIQKLMTRAMEYTGISGIELKTQQVPDPVPPEALRHTWLVPGGASPIPRVLLPESLLPELEAERPGGVEGVGVTSTGSAELDQWITGLVTHVSEIPFKTIGVIGLIALLYAAISMLVEIERAFNQIYRVPIGRSWTRRVTNYWTLLTLGVVLLFATFYIGDRFTDWAKDLARSGGLASSDDSLSVHALGFAVTTLISTGLLLLAYTTVPNTRVRLRPALAGAFIAAVLWESGKRGFGQYVEYATSYTRLYGSLAILPLFLIWIYLTWLIVLLGLQISYFLQFEHYRRVPAPADGPKVPAVADPALGAAVIGVIARAFQNGGALPVSGIASTVRAGEEAVRAVLARLSARGLIHAVEKDGAPEAYALARPAELIQMTEVLEASFELVAPPPGQPEDPALERLHRAQLDAVRGQSVAAFHELTSTPPPAAAPAPAVTPAQPLVAERPANGQPKSSWPGQTPSAPATLPPVG